MRKDIHSLFEKISKGNIIVAYEGVISSDLISDTLSQAENKLTADGESPKVIRKVYNILVEALQNLFHHLEIPPKVFFEESEFEQGSHFAMFSMVKENKGAYKITTGNFVKNETRCFLRDRIEQLNYLSQDELKELYKLILNNDEFSAKGGGGLGFIEMARKSGNKFGFDFIKLNNDYYLFTLEILVS